MQCVEEVLGIAPGRLPWRASLGCRVFRLRHMGNGIQRQELARVDVYDALTRWEPRCRVRGVALVAASATARNLLDLTASVEISGRVVSLKRTI